jgi:hypothetical protein
MEITKEKLLSILSESYSEELDEMGLKTDRDDKYVNTREIYDKDKNHIGWEIRTDMSNEESPLVPIFFACPDIKEFESRHPEVFTKLREKYGDNLYFTNDKCVAKRPEQSMSRKYYHVGTGLESEPIVRKKYTPKTVHYIYLDGEPVEKFKTEEEAMKRLGELQNSNPDANYSLDKGVNTKNAQEKIKRIFNPILVKEFSTKSEEGKEFSETLNKRSIPTIIPNNPKYLDTHNDVWTNDKIYFRSLSYNTYESGKDLLAAVFERAKGNVSNKMKTDYLAMQFNKVNVNWDEARKSNITYKGKTDDPNYVPKYSRKNSYGLHIQGYEESNMDVSMKMVFEIDGEKIGDSFVWTLTMVNKFGRKRPEDTFIPTGLKPIELVPGGVLDGKKLISSHTVQLNPNVKYDNKNTIMSDPTIVEGLEEAIDKFKKMISDIKPAAALRYANISRKDVVKENGHVESLIKNTINELFK